MDSKMVARNNGFCGRRRRRRFCLSLTAGVIFFFSLHVFVLEMLRFSRGFQICQRHIESWTRLL